ncbi:MAG: cytochrome c biogenesis protein CcsA [Oscillospiraceae bacterium]|nr:cytochrome c biogenesis protein CcsA [Oscillospiraceae bacterium]
MLNVLNVIFFAGLLLYFAAGVLEFLGIVFKKETLTKLAWILFLIGAVCNTVYLVARGIIAGRLPLSNQFEFATAFAWGIAIMLIVLQTRFKAEWIRAAAIPMAFLVLSYAALQPREITELMPALRSTWFGLHIGSAVFSYASFVLAGCCGIRYLLMEKKGDSMSLGQIDYLCYRLVALGFLLLTIVILSGAIWAEQAWSAFWTWDPKETWALITWILYAIYLHLRMRRQMSGKVMAWFVVIAVPVVLFTFVGVNTLLPGLHSYG